MNAEVLAALPPEIQEELLLERGRAMLGLGAADPSHAQEMDNASFLATLPADLRNEILLSQNDNFLQTLPAAVQAEARALRERAGRHHYEAGGARAPGLPGGRVEGARYIPASMRFGGRYTDLAGTRRGNSYGGVEEKVVAAKKEKADGVKVFDNATLLGFMRILYAAHGKSISTDFLKLISTATHNAESRQFILRTLVGILATTLPGAGPEAELAGVKNLENLYTLADEFNPSVWTNHPLVGYDVGGAYAPSPMSRPPPPAAVVSRIVAVLHSLVKNDGAMKVDIVDGTAATSHASDSSCMVQLMSLLSYWQMYYAPSTVQVCATFNFQTLTPFIFLFPFHEQKLLEILDLSLKHKLALQAKVEKGEHVDLALVDCSSLHSLTGLLTGRNCSDTLYRIVLSVIRQLSKNKVLVSLSSALSTLLSLSSTLSTPLPLLSSLSTLIIDALVLAICSFLVFNLWFSAG